jgi:hypothetical protein
LDKRLPYADAEIADGMRAARDHFRSGEFEVAKAQVLDYLR